MVVLYMLRRSLTSDAATRHTLPAAALKHQNAQTLRREHGEGLNGWQIVGELSEERGLTMRSAEASLFGG